MGGCALANPPGTVRREDGELNHAGDGKQTRTLAEHRDAAVHSGDTTGVLRDDAAGIVIASPGVPDSNDVACAHALLRCGEASIGW